MIASGLVANGATVYIVSRKKDVCEETAKELNERYNCNRAVSKPGDLSNIKGVEAFVKSLNNVPINVLINNAGATWGSPYETYPDEKWAEIFDLNVRHLFNLTRLLTPQLEAAANVSGGADPSRVVNIASVDGVRAQQTFGPTAAFAYTASKGAVVHLTKALCRALSSKNITVNCVAPGIFPSQMTAFMYKSASVKEAIEDRNPLKRNGRTSDIAGTIIYLVSPAGAFTNGVTIVVDGGGFLHDASL